MGGLGQKIVLQDCISPWRNAYRGQAPVPPGIQNAYALLRVRALNGCVAVPSTISLMYIECLGRFIKSVG